MSDVQTARQGEQAPEAGELRIGLMGASTAAGLATSLEKGFAGAGMHFVSLAGATREEYPRLLRSCDVVQVTAWTTSRWWALPAVKARCLGKPVIRYWVGTDVWNVQRSRGQRVRAQLADRAVCLNLTKWTNLQRELRAVGITGEVCPAPHRDVLADPVTELPPRLTILAYLSIRPWKWDLYGGDVILRLAREHPQWRFLIVNHTGEGLPEMENVEFLGRVPHEEMDGVYRRASALVRITQHDGLPRMILEALGRGLHAVWNQPFPHCRCATDYDQVRQVLQEIATEGVNHEGRRYVRREFDPRRLAALWREMYERVLSGSRR